jgi:hypothetical protein
MKKILLISPVLFVLFSISSCSTDLLDSLPETQNGKVYADLTPYAAATSYSDCNNNPLTFFSGSMFGTYSLVSSRREKKVTANLVVNDLTFTAKGGYMIYLGSLVATVKGEAGKGEDLHLETKVRLFEQGGTNSIEAKLRFQLVLNSNGDLVVQNQRITTSCAN